MLRSLGKINQKELVLATGLDSIRGIIGREDILDKTLLLFKNCPQIHSFFVRQPFYVTFISADYRDYECLRMSPNRLSKMKSWNSICLESKSRLSATEIENVIKLFRHKSFD
jgi:hypothetical protein